MLRLKTEGDKPQELLFDLPQCLIAGKATRHLPFFEAWVRNVGIPGLRKNVIPIPLDRI
jgi:hypothetical protein